METIRRSVNVCFREAAARHAMAGQNPKEAVSDTMHEGRQVNFRCKREPERRLIQSGPTTSPDPSLPFCSAAARFEPSSPNFCDAAKVCNHGGDKNVQQPLGF